jgi:hypothetical protein
MWGGGSMMNSGGFELQVFPSADGEGAQMIVAPPPPLTRDEALEYYDRTTFAVRGCVLSLGGAVGATDTSRDWEFLDEPYIISASPAGSFSCEGGSATKMWWFAGVDSAPFYVYRFADGEMRHGAAATMGVGYGSDKLSAGVYGSAGLVILGAGARLVYMPFQMKNGGRHGPDLRASWMPSDAWSFEVLAMWGWRLGA